MGIDGDRHSARPLFLDTFRDNQTMQWQIHLRPTEGIRTDAPAWSFAHLILLPHGEGELVSISESYRGQIRCGFVGGAFAVMSIVFNRLSAFARGVTAQTRAGLFLAQGLAACQATNYV